MRLNESLVLKYQLKQLWDECAKDTEQWCASIPIYEPGFNNNRFNASTIGYISVFDKGDDWAVVFSHQSHGRHSLEEEMPAILAKFSKTTGEATLEPTMVASEGGRYYEMAPVDLAGQNWLRETLYDRIQNAMYQHGLTSLYPVSHEITAVVSHPPLSPGIALG